MNNNELTNYMNTATQRLIANILKSTFKNSKETSFLLRFKKEMKNSIKKRKDFSNSSQHIPSFLICSITSACNLHCKGCYARANGICGEDKNDAMLSDNEWSGIFEQAKELGILFCLLAGGEPLLRQGIIDKAAACKEIIFPIFTNGSLINDDYITIFNENRNLVPVLSIEGNQELTDLRRGEGTYNKILDSMMALQKNKILFGVSITVTTKNIGEITSKIFIDMLNDMGCRLVFFIEYVPIDSSTQDLAPTDNERNLLAEKQKELRDKYDTMIFLSFPGDEKFMGGCLAAGRGFFHINPYGAAEACPFSPYSDRSLKNYTLLEALQSPLFNEIQDKNLTWGEHDGGCTLFDHVDEIESLLTNNK